MGEANSELWSWVLQNDLFWFHGSIIWCIIKMAYYIWTKFLVWKLHKAIGLATVATSDLSIIPIDLCSVAIPPLFFCRWGSSLLLLSDWVELQGNLQHLQRSACWKLRRCDGGGVQYYSYCPQVEAQPKMIFLHSLLPMFLSSVQLEDLKYIFNLLHLWLKW